MSPHSLDDTFLSQNSNYDPVSDLLNILSDLDVGDKIEYLDNGIETNDSNNNNSKNKNDENVIIVIWKDIKNKIKHRLNIQTLIERTHKGEVTKHWEEGGPIFYVAFF